jgi:hypothetical protein
LLYFLGRLMSEIGKGSHVIGGMKKISASENWYRIDIAGHCVWHITWKPNHCWRTSSCCGICKSYCIVGMSWCVSLLEYGSRVMGGIQKVSASAGLAYNCYSRVTVCGISHRSQIIAGVHRHAAVYASRIVLLACHIGVSRFLNMEAVSWVAFKRFPPAQSWHTTVAAG